MNQQGYVGHGSTAIPLSWLTEEGVNNDIAVNNARVNGVNKDKYGYTAGGLAYLMNNSDSYINAYNKEKEWLREDMLRKEGYKREDEAYDRLFETLKRNGINPALLLSSASPVVGSYNNSTSSVGNSNFSTNEKTEAANNAKMFASIIAAIASMAAILLA